MNRRRELKNCFIIAPIDVNILLIEKLLKERNIKTYDPSQISLTEYISSSVQKEIRNSDFVIAIVSFKEAKPNIFYELGLARGAGKPVFLIIQDDGPIPVDLTDMVYVRTTLGNHLAIAFALDQFISKYKHKLVSGLEKSPYRGRFASRTLVRSRKKRKPSVTPLQGSLENIAKSGTEAEFESFLTGLLKSEGVILTQHYEAKETGADMALWIDSLENKLGNPLLVELKFGRLSEPSLERAEKRLRHYLTVTNTRTGLLIYLEPSGKRFRQAKAALPLVIRFDVRDLTNRLAYQSLASVLLQERNRIVHGV
jgi:hypothetical protein